MTGVNKEQKNVGQTVSQNMKPWGRWHPSLTCVEAVPYFMQNHTQRQHYHTLPSFSQPAYWTCRALANKPVGDKGQEGLTCTLLCQQVQNRKPSLQRRMRGTRRGEVEEEHMANGDLVSFSCLLSIPSSTATPGITTPCGIWRPAKFYFL